MRDPWKHLLPAWCRIPTAGALLLVVLFLLFPEGVLAEDASADWRPTYDLALRWINFFILVFLIFKYARKPLVNFFKEKSEDIKKEIRAVEKEKENILARVDEMIKARDHSQEKLEKLKERIIAQGKAKKQRIIENAQKESKLMLEGARRKITSQMITAQQDLRAEMIDHAIDVAMQKLPGVIDEKDDRQIYENYLKSTEGI